MIRSEIRSIVSQIPPLDQEEAEHIAFVEKWIDSGAEIFRIKKPATPDPHLAAYCLLLDPKERQILLTEHKISNLWIPAGGHVEINEHPKKTVCRELVEELGIQANFLSESPFFLTITKISDNLNGHTDISLWYILQAGKDDFFQWDEREFHSIRWFALDEIPLDQSERHMGRFIQKLRFHKILQ